MSYYNPMTWSLFKTEEEKINPTLAPNARPEVQAMTPERQIYNQNIMNLMNRGFDEGYAKMVLENPSMAETFFNQGLLVDLPKNTGAAMAYQAPQVPPLQNLNPDVKEVLSNLGVKGKGTENLSKAAAAAETTSGMDYMSLLKILGMVNSGSQTQSNVTPAITPGITPAVAGAKIEDEDLYARYRR